MMEFDPSDDELSSVASTGTAVDSVGLLDNSDSDSDYDSNDDSLDFLTDGPGAAAAAFVAMRPRGRWHNDPNRPRDLEAALTLLGDHVEHFTRFAADEMRDLVAALAVPDFFFVSG